MRTRTNRHAAAAPYLGLCSALLLSGCASTGAPRAPSLMLPQIVRGMQAERYGNHVNLHWSTPTSTTDRQPLARRKHGAGTLTAEVCRVQGDICAVFTRQAVAPGEQAETIDRLDAALLLGSPRAVRYRIRLLNGAGRSAGWSRDAVAVAGEAPAPIANLAAGTINQGVQLTWRAVTPAPGERILLQAATTGRNGATERNLAAAAGAGGAIDIAPKVGDTVRYTVVRTRIVQIDGEQHALNGEPATVQTTMQKDTFPPERPRGLMAVAVQMDGTAPEIDLSWEPNTEPDLLGYVVYRADSAAESNPTRLNRDPVQTVSYRDSTVVAGHTYVYTVAAVDRSGNESARSAAAEEQLH